MSSRPASLCRVGVCGVVLALVASGVASAAPHTVSAAAPETTDRTGHLAGVVTETLPTTGTATPTTSATTIPSATATASPGATPTVSPSAAATPAAAAPAATPSMVASLSPVGAGSAAIGTTTAQPTVFIGTVTPKPADAARLKAAGLTSVVLQLGWDAAQPTPGVLDQGLVTAARAAYDTYAAAGLQVTLDTGLQYPPAWVLALPGARFVDQYGDTFSAAQSSGENAADAVYNPVVQAAQAQYVAELGVIFAGRPIAAVRAGGLLTGELRYPGASYAGHTNAIWDYSVTAQATSPVPLVQPGLSTATDTLLLDHYVSGITVYQDFLVTTIKGTFPAADIETLYPSWGIRPGDVAAAVANGVRGGSVRFNEVAFGTDAAALVARIPTYTLLGGHRVIAYSTWVDAADQGTSPQGLSPVGYISSIAKPLGVPVAGENTADSGNSPAALALAHQRVKALGLVGLLWFDPQLTDAGAAVTPSMLPTAP